MLAVAYVVGVLKPSFLSLTGTSHTIMGYHGYRFYNCYPVQMFKSYFKSLYRLGPKSFHQQSLCLGMLSQSMEWGFKRGQATMVHRPHIPLPSSVTKNRSEAEYGAWKKGHACLDVCGCVCVCVSVCLGQLGWQSISFSENTEPFPSQYCIWFYVLWSSILQ